MFEHLKVGDKVTRAMPSFDAGQLWYWDGTVKEVNDKTIKAEFIVDQPRTMEFCRESGIDTLGEEYGWLITNS